MSVKIGLLGCSSVAKKYFFPFIQLSELANIEIIGSRSLTKAREWARKYKCNQFGSYEDVINSGVDAIYITLPIGSHEQWALKSANAGKHVLCEKSSTTSYESAKNMVKTARKNNVKILEAFSFRFHPQHEKIRELIANEIGQTHHFYGIYGFPPPLESDIRWQKELGGGVLNDVTCYPLCASRFVFESEPVSVLSHLEFSDKFNVDKCVDIIVKYPGGKTAFISSGFNHYYQSKYSVWGSEGRITTQRAYAVPRDYKTSVYLDKHDIQSETVIPLADQYAIMFDIFCNVITNRIKMPFNFENDLLEQAKLMESVRISGREQRLVPLSEIT